MAKDTAVEQAGQLVGDRWKPTVIIGRINRPARLAAKVKVLVNEVEWEPAIGQHGKTAKIVFERQIDVPLEPAVQVELDQLNQRHLECRRIGRRQERLDLRGLAARVP